MHRVECDQCGAHYELPDDTRLEGGEDEPSTRCRECGAAVESIESLRGDDLESPDSQPAPSLPEPPTTRNPPSFALDDLQRDTERDADPEATKTEPGGPPPLLDADADSDAPPSLDFAGGTPSTRATLPGSRPAMLDDGDDDDDAADPVEAASDGVEETVPISATPSIGALVQRTRQQRDARKNELFLETPVYDHRPPDIQVDVPDVTDEASTSASLGRSATRTDAPVAGTRRPPPPERRSRSGLPLLALALLGGGVLFFVGRALREGHTDAVTSPAVSQPLEAPANLAAADGAREQSSLSPATASASEPAELPGNAPAGDPTTAADVAKPIQAASTTRALSGSRESQAPAPSKGRPTSIQEPPATEAVPEPEPPPAEFNANAASLALDAAATRASSCRKSNDPSGVATVTITFAPSGRVTSATVSGPPFAGTETGGCIASTMRDARVPPFAGELMTVRKTVAIY